VGRGGDGERGNEGAEEWVSNVGMVLLLGMNA
jgi:hypothetical protein